MSRKRSFVFQWLYDLPLSRKLSLLVWGYLIIIAVLLTAGIFSLRALSANRAFVNTEALWSKAQKEAVIHLILYAKTNEGAETQYSAFLKNLSVQSGIRDATLEMDRPSPDLSMVTEGFAQGGIHPDDAVDMLWLFKWFRHLEYTERALETWKEGDRIIQEITALAVEMRRERSASSPDRSRISSLISRVLELNGRLTFLEERFSAILAEEARWLKGLTTSILLTMASFLVLMATGLSFLISRRIRDGIFAIRDGAEKVGGGDLTSRIAVESSDELGVLAGDLNRMTDDLSLAREGLRRSEERYRFLVENIPQRIFYKDRESVFIACNRAMAEDLHISPSEFAGKTDYDFFPRDLAEKYRADDRRVMELGTATEFDESYLKNGREGVVHTVKAPVRDDEGRVVGILGIFWDITEKKVMEEELRKYTEALERSNRELEQFAYIASHDLQEPLRKISGFSELLAKRYRGRIDEKADMYIRYIVDGTDRMGTLINDLLTYSRLFTRAKGFAPADCNALLSWVLSDLSRVIEENGASVTSDQLPVVMADDTQLGQVFQNLISNAIKFRGEEPPKVHVSAVGIPEFLEAVPHLRPEVRDHLMAARKGWVFCVKDNGIGVAPQYHEQIFQIFQRLHSRAEYPGTGIGLAVCRNVVERHGGRIWVESEAGRGSAFFFTLPERGTDYGEK